MVVSRLVKEIETLEREGRRYRLGQPELAYDQVVMILRDILGPVKYTPTIRWESGQRLHHKGYVNDALRFRIEPHQLWHMLELHHRGKVYEIENVPAGKKLAAEILKEEYAK